MTHSGFAVVIPSLHDHDALASTLTDLRQHFDGAIVVVDGGDDAETRRLARAADAQWLPSAPGRGIQLAAGAAATTADTLLFAHADTRLAPGFAAEAERVLALPDTAAGAFRFRLDDSRWSLRLVERGVGLRSRWLQLPYGDQGLFLRRQMLSAAGGVPPLAAMEDLTLVRRLKRLGRVRISPMAATTSARKWVRCGVLRTTAINQACLAAFFLRVPPARIARWRQGC